MSLETIQIQVNGTLKLDNTTIVVNPLLTVETALDNYREKTVFVNCLFTNETEQYSINRDAGSFQYVETWDDENVINHLLQWIEAHKID